MVDNVFKGSIETAKMADFEKPLGSSTSPSCDFYTHAYSKAASEAENGGQKEESLLFRFLSVICSFHATFGNREQPYGPMYVMEGRRSIIPEDLTPNDIDVVRILLERSTDPALKARLGDVLWVRCKDFKAARTSAEHYLESGKRLTNLKDCWSQAPDEFLRAIQLATILGRKNEPFPTIISEIQKVILSIPPEEKSFRACQLIDVLLGQDAGSFESLIGVANKHALANQTDYYMAREYWDVEARLLRSVGRQEEAKAALLSSAHTLIDEARSRVSGADPSYMAGSRFLAQGIEALRQSGGDPLEVEKLKTELLVWQSKSNSELKNIDCQIDISKAIKNAQKHVDHSDLEKATIKFVFGYPLVDPSDLRDEVLKTAKRYPLSHMFGASYIDGDGRVVDTGISLLNTSAPGYEEEVQAAMVQHATHYIWGLRAQAYIEPAREVIWQNHHPRVKDITWLLRGHPFVPPGHEVIIGRGLLAGFHADWLMVAHLLVPQVENSIRHVLRLNGVDVTNLMSDMTQPLKVCAQIIGHNKAKDIFGEDMIFELKGLLLEKRGHQLRHQVAHGMADNRDCYSPATVNVWWLFLRLCVIGASNSRASTPSSPKDTTESKQ